MISSYNSWDIVREIGSGSFGTVYEIQREDFGKVYKAALKVISVPKDENETVDGQNDTIEDLNEYYEGIANEIANEFDIMFKLHGNTNIVNYEDHDVVRHKNGIGFDIYIRMELLTSLDRYLTDHEMTRRDVIKMGIDICQALERCQMFHIMHRDIKPSNIFVSEQGDFKLGDFGIARTVEKHLDLELSKKGTYNYMAPEVYKGADYSFDVDMYSLAIVMYRLLNHNRVPFLPAYPAKITHTDRNRAVAMRMRGDVIPLPDQDSTRLGEIILKACSYLPEHRYSSPTAMRKDLEAILYSEEERETILGDREVINTPGDQSVSSGSGSSFLNKESIDAAIGPRMTVNDDETIVERTDIRPVEVVNPPKTETEEDLPQGTGKHIQGSSKSGKWMIACVIAVAALLVILLSPKLLPGSAKPSEANNAHTNNDVVQAPASENSGDEKDLNSEDTNEEERPKYTSEIGDAGYTIEKFYDDKYRLIKQVESHADKSPGHTFEYIYDEQDHLVSEITYHADGTIWKKTDHNYQNGKLVEDREYEKDVLVARTEYEWYGESERFSLEFCLDPAFPDELLFYTSTCTYTDDNKLLYEDKRVSPENGYYEIPGGFVQVDLGSREAKDQNTYNIARTLDQYDFSGQLVKKSEYARSDTGEYILIDYCEIKYDYRFRQTQQSWYYADGSVSGHAEYDYSEDGSTINQRMFNARGEIIAVYKNETAPDGKLTITQYGKDGSIILQSVYSEDGEELSSDEYNVQGM